MIVFFYDEAKPSRPHGEWFFAGSDAGGGIVPDVITVAKALGSGIPVGACLVSEKVASHIKENDLGTTFGGGMMAMAAVNATLEAIENDSMLENVKEVEARLRDRITEIPQVTQVEVGVFAVEGCADKQPIQTGLLERG